MPQDPSRTGTDDVTYNLVSVLYHTLQEAETVEKYIGDAEKRGKNEIVEFFRELKEENRRRGERLKELLRSSL
jgi:rubrerythrin